MSLQHVIVIRLFPFCFLGSTAAADGKGWRVQDGLDMAGTHVSQRMSGTISEICTQQKVFVLENGQLQHVVAHCGVRKCHRPLPYQLLSVKVLSRKYGQINRNRGIKKLIKKDQEKDQKISNKFNKDQMNQIRSIGVFLFGFPFSNLFDRPWKAFRRTCGALCL